MNLFKKIVLDSNDAHTVLSACLSIERRYSFDDKQTFKLIYVFSFFLLNL